LIFSFKAKEGSFHCHRKRQVGCLRLGPPLTINCPFGDRQKAVLVVIQKYTGEVCSVAASEGKKAKGFMPVLLNLPGDTR